VNNKKVRKNKRIQINTELKYNITVFSNNQRWLTATVIVAAPAIFVKHSGGAPAVSTSGKQ